MFARIIQWLRELWSRIAMNPSDVKSATGLDVAVSPLMIINLRKWCLAYYNQAEWLKDGVVRSLNLPAAIAGELARLTTLEMKVKVEGDSLRAAWLQEQVDRVTPKLRMQVEYAMAKGGLMMKPYIDADGQVQVDFSQADQFYPVEFDSSGNITACVFADQRQVAGVYYTRLELHRMVDDGCLVVNQAFRSTGAGQRSSPIQDIPLGTKVPLASVPDWADMQEEATIKGIRKPLFAYFKNPTANNIDSSSPLGISAYARVMDLIRQADQQWTDLLWEFESGRRALYVDEAAFDRGRDGKPVLPHRLLYRALKEMGGVGDDNFFEEWSPDLREQNILNGLDAILRKIEFNCGLAYGTLSNPETIDKTATEIVSAKQRSFATVSDIQKGLQDALDKVLYAMDVWTTIGKLAPKGAWSTSYDFDDSIVRDKDAQFQSDLRLVTTGVMSKLEFRMRNFGEDEDTAKQKLALAQGEAQAEMSLGQPTNPQQE